MLLIMSRGTEFQKAFIPTGMNLKVSCFVSKYFFFGIKTLQSQKRIFTKKKYHIWFGGSSSPINRPIKLQSNTPFYVSKITIYDIFIVFGLQIPFYHVHCILWTKLAPALHIPGVYIIHCGP